MRKPDMETMHIRIHGTDLAHLPFAGKLKWLIEFPRAWRWFLTWAPKKAPDHFKDHNMRPAPGSLSSSPSGPSSFGSLPPAGSSRSTLTSAPAASMPSFGPPPATGTQPSSSTLPTTTSKQLAQLQVLCFSSLHLASEFAHASLSIVKPFWFARSSAVEGLPVG